MSFIFVCDVISVSLNVRLLMFSFDFYLYLFTYLFFLLLLSFCGWVVDVIVHRYLNHYQETMNEIGRNVGRRNFMDPNRGGMRNQYLNPSIGN